MTEQTVKRPRGRPRKNQQVDLEKASSEGLAVSRLISDIGLKSKDGLLEVVDVYRDELKNICYKVTCSVCSPDTELSPDGCFTIRKCNFDQGNKPCGCSKAPKWKEQHYSVLVSRACKDKNYTLTSQQDFKGKLTRIVVKCNECGNERETNYDALLNSKSKCNGCWQKRKKLIFKADPKDVIEKVLTQCKIKNYHFVGFLKPYENNRSKFLYMCKEHGVKSCTVANFISNRRGCPDCATEMHSGSGFYGYYPKRKDEQDFFYVMKIGEYIKVGRSFDVEKRIESHKDKFKTEDIELLYTFSDKHQHIFKMEQDMLKYLKSLGYLLKDSPSPRETFKLGCEEVLFSKIKEVTCGRD